MTRQTLADRLVTYSDTVVAFALVNGFAFLITLGEPDIRCSIAAVSSIAFALNIVFPIVGTYALFWLRGYERKLREEEELNDEDPIVASFTRVLFRVRIGLIWIFAVLVVVGIWGATQDPQCTVASVVAP